MDERLRGLERRAQDGDLDAAAALVVERIRVGALPRARVALAAHLGAPAALRALGVEAAAPTTDLFDWFARLGAFGAPAVVRALVAAARVVLPAFEEEARGDERPARALDAAAAWCDAPSPALAQAGMVAGRHARRAGEEVGRQARLDGEWQEDQPKVRIATYVAYLSLKPAQAAHGWTQEGSRADEDGLGLVLRIVEEFVRELRDYVVAPILETKDRVISSEDELKGRVRDELIAWGLGS